MKTPITQNDSSPGCSNTVFSKSTRSRIFNGAIFMNRFFTWLSITLLILATSDALGQYVSWPEKELFSSDQERYGHLEYFGFYGSAMGGWNFTGELAPFTNLTWIQVGSADGEPAAIEKIIQRLSEARDAGVAAVLHIEPFLFISGEGLLRPDPEIEDFLVELRAQVEFENLLDTIAMIYPIDEPFRELISERDPGFIKEHVTGEAYEEIHEDLVHLNGLIKLVFPEKPIGVILSGYKLHHRFFSIPENYDWVGFDCYQDLFRSCNNKTFVEHYSQLLKHMQPHQRLMAVPETWATNETKDQAGWPDILSSRLKHHYEIALNEPRFIAFIPFIWSFDAGQDTPGLGLNRFSELYDDGVSNRGTAFLNEVIDIGLQIKLGEPEMPNMSYDETENSPYRPVSRIRGEITGVSSLGLVSAWALDESLPHKNLRVRILVRDTRGTLIHKSRIERTFIRDPALAKWLDVVDPMPGLHGFRYQLPDYVMARSQRQPLEIEMITYADGSPREDGSVYSVWVNPGKKLSRWFNDPSRRVAQTEPGRLQAPFQQFVNKQGGWMHSDGCIRPSLPGQFIQQAFRSFEIAV